MSPRSLGFQTTRALIYPQHHWNHLRYFCTSSFLLLKMKDLNVLPSPSSARCLRTSFGWASSGSWANVGSRSPVSLYVTANVLPRLCELLPSAVRLARATVRDLGQTNADPSHSLNSRDRLREKVTKAGVQLNHVGHGRSFQQSFSASNTPKVCPLARYGSRRAAGLISQDRKSPTLTGGVAVQIETITEYSSYHPRQVSISTLSLRVTFETSG